MNDVTCCPICNETDIDNESSTGFYCLGCGAIWHIDGINIIIDYNAEEFEGPCPYEAIEARYECHWREVRSIHDFWMVDNDR